MNEREKRELERERESSLRSRENECAAQECVCLPEWVSGYARVCVGEVVIHQIVQGVRVYLFKGRAQNNKKIPIKIETKAYPTKRVGGMEDGVLLKIKSPQAIPDKEVSSGRENFSAGSLD